MTFLDKLKVDHPDVYVAACHNGMVYYDFGCPAGFGYEPVSSVTEMDCIHTTCRSCWSREMASEDEMDEQNIDMKGLF